MTDKPRPTPEDDPFLLILDASVGGHINGDEVTALLMDFWPEKFNEESLGAPRPEVPRIPTLPDAIAAAVRRRVADDLEAFAGQGEGESISRSAVRSFAARLRRTA
jgi:hypothetical protein